MPKPHRSSGATRSDHIPASEAVSKSAKDDPTSPGRGRDAESPTDLPRQGWRDIFWRTQRKLSKDNLPILAAGVAYYAFIASVPGLLVVMVIYAWVADASSLTRHLNLLSRIVPSQVFPLIQEQMTRISQRGTHFGGEALVSVLISFWSSAKAIKGLMSGLNIAYNERERRRFFHRNAVALALTLGGIVGIWVAVGLLTSGPTLMREWFSHVPHHLFIWMRWPVLVVWFMFGAAALYRYGPSRNTPQWKWISAGALTATTLWVLGSAIFSFYVSEFDRYAKAYGSLGAVVIFLFWLYLSAYVILLGAELNSEMERQTRADTTTGKKKALGRRGAYSADTVGPSKK